MIDLRDHGETLDVWFSRIRPLLPDAFVVETRPHHDPMLDELIVLTHGADSINMYSWTAPGDKQEAVDPFFTGVNESNTIGNVRAFIVGRLAVSHESQMLSVADLAKRWNVGRTAIEKMIKAKTIHAVNVAKGSTNKRWRVPIAEVERHESGQRRSKPAQTAKPKSTDRWNLTN